MGTTPTTQQLYNSYVEIMTFSCDASHLVAFCYELELLVIVNNFIFTVVYLILQENISQSSEETPLAPALGTTCL